jgi:hypothetical protein
VRSVAAAVLAASLALGGCSLTGGADAPPPAAKREPAEARTIRAWNAALNAGDFEKAASFFAAGAIVEQVVETRLRTRRDAIRFNSSLPCASRVTDVEDEGRTIVAAFRLSRGRRGGCRGGGTARVRFVFENGKFKEWRQLLESDRPPSQIA